MEREIRVRVGDGGRLECMVPKGLAPAAVSSRMELVKELASLFRSAKGKGRAAKSMLYELAQCTDRDEARRLEKAIRRFQTERLDATPAEVIGDTFKEFANKWLDGVLASQKPDYVEKLDEQTVRVNRSRVNWLIATIGNVRMASFTKEDADKAMANLPPGAKSRSTRRHYAQVIQTVVKTAVHPFNLLKANPLPENFLPTTGAPPSYPVLYPDDVRALLSCGKIPPWRRVLYALSIYESLRLSHILSLTWNSIGFHNDTITVPPVKAVEQARTWEPSAGTIEVLRWFREQGGEGTIIPFMSDDEKLDVAEMLREDLHVAGVDKKVRPDLYGMVKGQRPIRFQDLRATFVTLHLAMGWTETDVMEKTGHTNTNVLHKHYARRVSVAKGIVAKQGPLPSMAEAFGLQKAARGGGKSGGKKRRGN